MARKKSVKRFRIGVFGKKKVEMDLLRLIDTRMLICANSGGGKSYLLRLIAEQAANQVQTIIIDPEGEFGTLRELLDILIVGDEGEIAVDVRSAAILARKLAETRVSAVINMYDLDSWGERRRYCAAFLEALMKVPKKMWHPILIMIDEAHMFAPETGGRSRRNDPVMASKSAISSLQTAGRKRGFSGLLATHRVSKLHKDSIAECKNVFIGNTVLDIDQQRSGDMLGFSKADRLALRDLMPGEFFCFGPAVLAKGVVRLKVDKVQTTHPQPGSRHNLVVPEASSAIVDILANFEDLPARAEEEKQEVDNLRRRVFELERDLREAKHARPTPERIEIPVLGEGDLSRLEETVWAVQNGISDVQVVAKSLSDAVTVIDSALHRPRPQRVDTRPTPHAAEPRVSAAGESNGRLPRAQRKILAVLAQYPQGKSLRQIAVLAGYSWRGGGFANAISACRTGGWITGNKELYTITNAGLDVLGHWEPLPTGKKLQEYWLNTLGKAPRKALEALIAVYPNTLLRDEVADRAGYVSNGGGFANALSRLRTLELISGSNDLRASDTLFDY